MKLLEHGWNDDRVFGHVTRPVVLQHRYQVRVKQTSAVEFPHAQPLKLFNKLFSKICVKLLSYCIVTNSFQPECSDFIPSFLSLKVSSLYMLQLWNMIFYNILEYTSQVLFNRIKVQIILFVIIVLSFFYTFFLAFESLVLVYSSCGI